MSDLLLLEACALSKQLSLTQKAQLIEWLSGDLRQALVDQAAESPLNGADAHHDARPSIANDQAWAEVEPTWTAAEIHALMQPDPKTGAEIVALAQTLDLSSWQEQDIPDVVEWLHHQREQQRLQRQAQWDALEQ